MITEGQDDGKYEKQKKRALMQQKVNGSQVRQKQTRFREKQILINNNMKINIFNLFLRFTMGCFLIFPIFAFFY